ncbi:MAG TPA: DUF1294 domain-containing protein [Noviherbaspirillum sp.]|uniref:DUF1294 domain-containing protein n=1 Tax=Noviherbaspirillum sp. TaxID=1926288 RepID=UPI002D5F80F1|nr:DUF1294 domain-containing protein [Noviherbaspirillum sp.]HYD96288.1 DUF1294 domain-containing protein [Noviherbaspirillum sp.]
MFLAAVLGGALAGLLPLFVPGLYLAASVLAFAAYGIDKAAARKNRPRTRERTLHAFSLAGGWPGALIAQTAFRHKTQKQPFRIAFWLTVAGNGVLLAAFLFARGTFSL